MSTAFLQTKTRSEFHSPNVLHIIVNNNKKDNCMVPALRELCFRFVHSIYTMHCKTFKHKNIQSFSDIYGH